MSAAEVIVRFAFLVFAAWWFLVNLEQRRKFGMAVGLVAFLATLAPLLRGMA